jgi:hypothetical protein
VPDRRCAADHGEREVRHDRVEQRGRRRVRQRQVAEHGGVVDPSPQRGGLLGTGRGLLGDGFVRCIAGDRRRARLRRARVPVDDHDERGVLLGRQTFRDGPPHAAGATGDHVGALHRPIMPVRPSDGDRPLLPACCAKIVRRQLSLRSDQPDTHNESGLFVRLALPTVEEPGPDVAAAPSTPPRSVT